MKHLVIPIMIFAGSLSSFAGLNILGKTTDLNARNAFAKEAATPGIWEQRNYTLPKAASPELTRSGNVTVNFSQKEEDEFDIILAVGIDNYSGDVIYYGNKEDWQTAELLPSSYTFLFWAEAAEEPYAYHIFADENAEISGDTDYVVDFNECTEEVIFQPKLQDGSIAKCPLENLDSETIVEEGNVRAGLWSLFVFIDDLLVDFSRGDMSRGVFDDGWSFDNEVLGNVFVNKGLTRISLLQHRMMCGDKDNDGIFYTTIAAIPAAGGVYSNDPADYAFISSPAVVTSAGEAKAFDYASCNFTLIYQDRAIYETVFWNRIGNLPATDNYYIGSNDACAQLGMAFYSYAGRIIAEGLDFSSGDDNPLGIQSHMMENINGEVHFMGDINAMNSPGNLSQYNRFQFGQGGSKNWTVNPWLDFAATKRKIIDGNSTPVLVAQQCWYPKVATEDLKLRNTIFHSFNGRNGEVRTIDFLGQTINVSLDGKPQDISQYPSLNKYLSAMTGQGNVWDIEIIDNNVWVNGEKGYNRTEIHFDSSAEDVWAPTLQTLRTLNSEGEITDCFNSSQDGSLLIYGGDFECHYNEYNGTEWFSVTECDIKIEYAVTGTDDWKELNVSENNEKFMMPGWGYCWESSLEDIPDYGTDTSYDLRITLTDATGNYQVQTLSPVFTIVGKSGISEIASSLTNGTARYFNLQGCETATPEQGKIYIEVNPDGRSRKVMIK